MEATNITDAGFPCVGSGDLLRTDTSQSTKRYHLTEVMRYASEKIGTAYTGKGFDNLPLTMECGFIWEDLLEFILAQRYADRIDEVEMDNIIGSPDGIGPDPFPKVEPTTDLGIVVEEYKFTWLSVNKSPLHNWYYMTQLKSYCYMLGLDTAVMRILYCMGNYRGSGPLPGTYKIKFTEEEMQRNWCNIILKYAEIMRSEGVLSYDIKR